MLKRFIKTFFFFVVIFLLFIPAARSKEALIKNAGDYFPDRIGLSWIYEGTIEDGIQQISTYTNVATMKGHTRKDGVDVKIFTESNRANQGPAESYYSRNEDSIVYHGGDPTTPFEDHLVPYLMMQFPLAIHQTFTQVQKEGIPFGRDIDGDGIEELASVTAEVTVSGFETVTVPAGRFEDALKLKGLMVIRLTLSSNNKVVKLVDKTTNWFALSVGMVKGIESIEFPEVGERQATTTAIKESLSKFSEQPISKN